MRFFTAFMAVAAFATSVLAFENPFTKPDGSEKIIAGKPLEITWTPTSAGTITLTLRQGDSTNLQTIYDIAKSIENTGHFTWTPSTDLPTGANYALMITSAAGDQNYTPLLSIVGSDPKPSSSSSSSSATSSSSSSSTVASSSSITSSTISPPKPTTTITRDSNCTTYTYTATGGHSYGNHTVTRSSSGSAALPTTTEEPEIPENGASGFRSPIAFVACIVGAVVYFS